MTTPHVPAVSDSSMAMDPQKKITTSIVVDLAMICALATLSFWVGRQADSIDTLKVQVTAMAQNDNKSDVAALKERTVAQSVAMVDLKDTLLRRLDRLEQKLDQNDTAARQRRER